MKFSDIKEYELIDLDIHQEANATPNMTKEQYEALKIDIERNGQIEPVILYRGKIIDGRHRYRIMSELNKKTINTVSIPNNSTIADIKSLVKSKETHRHQTPTQLAIYAYRYMKNNNANLSRKEKEMTQAEASKEFGVGIAQIGRVARIDNKLMRPDILDMLFDGNKFNIGSSIRPLLSDSLKSIINYFDKLAAEQSTIDIGVELEDKLTEEDNIIINRFMNAIRTQKKIVMEGLSRKLYYEIINDTEEQ